MSSPFHQPHSGVPSLPLYCKPDPHQFWLDPGYYNPRRAFWTLEDHLKDKLDSIIRLPSSNKMTILWGLGCLESSPTKDTFWVGKALFRPLRSDKPEFLTRYDDYLEDIKELSRVGMIESFKVKSPDVLSEKHIITISLPGDPIPDFGHSIVTWAVMSGHAEELFIQSVKGIARRPQGDVDRDINRLWNLYQIIQTGMTGLCPPRRFSARKRVQYARMLFQYAVYVPVLTSVPVSFRMFLADQSVII